MTTCYTLSLSHAESALNVIDPTDRDIWLKCGMALQNEFGDAAFEVWDRWSQQATNYKSNDAVRTWKSFKNGGSITIGTLIHLAKEFGWRHDKIHSIIPNSHISTNKTNDINNNTENSNCDKESSQRAQDIYRCSTTKNLKSHKYVVNKKLNYIERLRIGSLGKQSSFSDCLLVPIFNEKYEISSLLGISEYNQFHGKNKTYLKGAKKSGGFLPLGPDFRGATKVLVGEGLATVDAAAQSCSLPGVVAFDAGNLCAVAKIVRRLAAPGAEIIILADDDSDRMDNPGFSAAKKAAEAINGVIAYPNLGKKADFWNVLNELGPEAVQSRVLKIPKEAESPSRFRLKYRDDILNSPDLEWVIKGVLPNRGVASIFGPSTAGKSFIVLDAATCIAQGKPWFGRKTIKTQIYYLCLEGQAGIKQRVQAWEIYNGQKFPDNFALITEKFNITSTNDIIDLASVVQKNSIIIIDTLSRASTGKDENSGKDMGEILENASDLQRMVDGLVILVAHTGKKIENGMRGHSSLPANLESTILVSRTKDTRSWTASKEKDAKDGEIDFFDLTVIDVGFDKDGDKISSCVVTPKNNARTSQRNELTGESKLGLDTFLKAAHAEGLLDNEGRFAGLSTEVWRRYFYEASTAPNINAMKKAFQRVRTKLVSLDYLIEINGLYRPCGDTALITEVEISNSLRKAEMGYRYAAGTLPAHVPQNNHESGTVLVPPSLEGVPSTGLGSQFPSEFQND